MKATNATTTVPTIASEGMRGEGWEMVAAGNAGTSASLPLSCKLRRHW
jgi:hypothetical protein